MSGRRAVTSDEKSRGLLYYLGIGLSGGLLAIMLLLAALVIVIPAVGGATPLTVLTSSMEPKLPPGTLVIIKPIAIAELKVGDVITYQIESGKPAVVTHRITELSTSSTGDVTFTTKGDNNSDADPLPVTEVQLKGKLWYSVPWIGYVSNFVNGDQRAWLIPTIAIGLFLYAGYSVASSISAAKKKRREARAAASEDATAAVSSEVSGQEPGASLDPYLVDSFAPSVPSSAASTSAAAPANTP